MNHFRNFSICFPVLGIEGNDIMRRNILPYNTQERSVRRLLVGTEYESEHGK